MKRFREFQSIPIYLDRTCGDPLYRQLYRVLSHGIRHGHIRAGARLPSTRFMSKQLGVSRNTVTTAYEALSADGLIQAEAGSGTRVVSTRFVPGLQAPRWIHLIRAARYPLRKIQFADPDGNALWLNW